VNLGHEAFAYRFAVVPAPPVASAEATYRQRLRRIIAFLHDEASYSDDDLSSDSDYMSLSDEISF
jgi:hypothetical protein